MTSSSGNNDNITIIHSEIYINWGLQNERNYDEIW